MDLQSVFYVMSIIFMLTILAAVISMAVALNHMKNNVIALRHDINQKIEDFKESAAPQVGAGVSAMATTLLTFALRKIFRRK